MSIDDILHEVFIKKGRDFDTGQFEISSILTFIPHARERTQDYTKVRYFCFLDVDETTLSTKPQFVQTQIYVNFVRVKKESNSYSLHYSLSESFLGAGPNNRVFGDRVFGNFNGERRFSMSLEKSPPKIPSQ